MFKTQYTVLVKKLNDGDLIETDGVIEGMTTKIIGKKKLQIGGVVRNRSGEII
ncbi:MAG: hypothetical protein WA102_04620 [Candidatus Methanoperedens sp.]